MGHGPGRAWARVGLKFEYINGAIPQWKKLFFDGGRVSLNTFDDTDYESALRFSENCLVLEKSI